MRNEARSTGISKRQAEYRARRKYRQRLFLLFLIIINVIVVLNIWNVNIQIKQLQVTLQRLENARYENEKTETVEISADGLTDYVSRISTAEVGKPRSRTWMETLQTLDMLGQSNPLIDEISRNNSLYPEDMLMALANNPEMADYVAGYPEYMQMQENRNTSVMDEKSEAAGLSEAEKAQEYPLLLQWDPRWGYQIYGKSNYIGIAGCGPTCLAMVMYYLTKEESFTPDRIAAYAMSNGYYVEGTGTAWALMKDLPETYGIEVKEHKISERALKGALEDGELLICAMREGDFTAAGHFIVIYGYDEFGFKVNDPNCVARSRRRWSYDEIGEQIKSVWGYRKNTENFAQTTFYML